MQITAISWFLKSLMIVLLNSCLSLLQNYVVSIGEGFQKKGEFPEREGSASDWWFYTTKQNKKEWT